MCIVPVCVHVTGAHTGWVYEVSFIHMVIVVLHRKKTHDVYDIAHH